MNNSMNAFMELLASPQLNMKDLCEAINESEWSLDFKHYDNDYEAFIFILCRNEAVNIYEMLELMLLICDTNVKTRKGETILHVICSRKDVDENLLNLVLKHGDDINRKDIIGHTPMHVLCMNKAATIELVNFMVANGGNLMIKNNIVPDNYLKYVVNTNQNIGFTPKDYWTENIG